MAKGQKTRAIAMTKTSDEGSIKLNKEELQRLNRKDLQGYCKRHGIKANAKV